MNKIVIYTAIFGGKDNLLEPAVVPEGCDFVCFTEEDFESSVWQIKKIERPLEDPVRSARMFKILTHQFLSEYEVSVWVDGNMLVRGDITELVDKHLNKVNMAVYNHQTTKIDPRNSIYQEADELLKMASIGKIKDDPELIKKQMAKYRQAGYPENNGLLSSMVVLRKHQANDIIKCMEDWWQELQENSRRDQLSFNYVAWKNKLNFEYINEDSRDNKYFLQQKHLFK